MDRSGEAKRNMPNSMFTPVNPDPSSSSPSQPRRPYAFRPEQPAPSDTQTRLELSPRSSYLSASTSEAKRPAGYDVSAHNVLKRKRSAEDEAQPGQVSVSTFAQDVRASMHASRPSVQAFSADDVRPGPSWSQSSPERLR